MIRNGALKAKERKAVEEDDDVPSIGLRDFSNLSFETDRAPSLHREESFGSIYRSARSIGPAPSERSFRSVGMVDRQGSFNSKLLRAPSEQTAETPRMETPRMETPRSRSGFSLGNQTPRSRSGVSAAMASTPKAKAAQVDDETAACLEEQLLLLAREHQEGLEALASDFSAREIQLHRCQLP